MRQLVEQGAAILRAGNTIPDNASEASDGLETPMSRATIGSGQPDHMSDWLQSLLGNFAGDVDGPNGSKKPP